MLLALPCNIDIKKVQIKTDKFQTKSLDVLYVGCRFFTCVFDNFSYNAGSFSKDTTANQAS